MHPSREIFRTIERLWNEGTIERTPVFFSRLGQKWEQSPVGDLESFYRYVYTTHPSATTLVTSYCVGEKQLLVAHYETARQACHQVWTIGEGNQLEEVYLSPLQSTRLEAA